MKKIFLILGFLFLLNVVFSQEIGEISFKFDKTPEVFMTGLSDTLIWSGSVIISFSDFRNLFVEETELVSYMVRKKDNNEVICGTMQPERTEPCKEDFLLLYGDIEKKIRQFEFFVAEDKKSLCSKRVSFLFHFVILPKERINHN